MMKKTKLGVFIGLILLIGGGALLIGIIVSGAVSFGGNINAPSSSVFTSNKVSNNVNKIEGQPVELIIPSLGYDLTIIPGYYNQRSRTWSLSNDKAQYATISPLPNNVQGNTFLYGHDRQEVFATLHTIKKGAQAIIKTSNNHTYYYQLSNVTITDQTDDAVFHYQGKPILTIQTCEGIFSQNRQMFIFDFQKVI